MAGKTPRLYLEHIQESIALIERRVAGKTFEDLIGDHALRDSIERRIEIISEASRRLPAEMKARDPGVPVARYRRHRQCASPRVLCDRSRRVVANRDQGCPASGRAVDELLAEVLRDW